MGIQKRSNEGKSPYSKYNKAPWVYGPTVTRAARAVKENRVSEYVHLHSDFVLQMLLSHVRRGIDVSRWPDLEWTRSDSRFRSEYAIGRRERASLQGPLSQASA